MPATTRTRIIDASTKLFMRQGLAASGLKEIASASGAPIGSLYHFFPDGKEQLAAETLRAAGAAYQELVESIFDAAPDVVSGTRACFQGAAAVLEATGYADACPIATVALEVASSNEQLRLVTSEVFTGWLVAAQRRLEVGGVPAARAHGLATTLIAALEGAFLLSRTARSPQPMHDVGDAMAELVARAIPA